MDYKKKRMTKKLVKINKIHKIKELDLNNIFIKNSDELIKSYDSLIKKEDYFDFLDYMINNELLSKCMEKEFKNYYETKQYIYPYPDSNIQFISYIKNSMNNKNYSDFAKLQLLLNNFISFSFSFKVISYIMKNKDHQLEDKDIIKYILTDNKNQNYIRKNFQCKANDFIIENLSRSFKKYLKKLYKINNTNLNFKNITFMDLSCYNFVRSYKISKYLGITNNNFYGIYTDINIKLNKNYNLIDTNFKRLNINLKIDFPDNSFDLIYCEFFLQKILDLQQMLKEIKRILRPNGYIMVISTMCIDKNDRLLSDIWNTLKYTLEKKNQNYFKHPVYERYFNYSEWDYIFNKYNLIYVTENILYDEVKKRTSNINYSNYAIYQNIKD